MSGYSRTYSGEGQALIVKEKCNKVIDFTSSYTLTNGDNSGTLTILNYENSFIGKKLLAGVFDGFSNKEFSSDGSLNFNTEYYFFDEFSFVVVFITGIYKNCEYSSYELDIRVPLVTNSSLQSNINSTEKAKGAEEFNKLLESNAGLKKIYLKLKAKNQ